MKKIPVAIFIFTQGIFIREYFENFLEKSAEAS